MQPPAIVFPDAEIVAVTTLQAALAARPESFAANVWVSHRMPPVDLSPKPARVVWVQRDGGPRLDQVREVARLRVNVFGDDENDTSDLMRLALALLWSSPNGTPILRVDGTSGPVEVPDENYAFRKFASVEVWLRGAPLTDAPIVDEASSSSSTSSSSSSS